MIVGIGVDTVDHARFVRALERAPALAERLFTSDERALSVTSLAARFAAREAAVKALGGLHGLALRDFPVRREAGGSPEFDLSPATTARLAQLGVATLHLSLTHDAGLATAFVVAEGAVAPPSPPQIP
ncbi:holo-[acyl-carrier-protein] synthase [Pseudoclavibacter endophyticus]|uniref:Holo-[acyl-carrier-protein] synthase n=1 Tax=Pseudoclavibacter endophyticus TaxID=1778590 RepID=A0A6H9WEJ0_9MICO|nr:holo-ACP synthase [Pseudoclavibacter endophyticus]KAB1649322.1 holo-ACP synthase [Pseudoclavibacter endophyticus]GGA63508.1 holo-[acyl-carrier-protein] synthase [Pseudoclavibacter endophyticus]